jgi:hypothetical protein
MRPNQSPNRGPPNRGPPIGITIRAPIRGPPNRALSPCALSPCALSPCALSPCALSPCALSPCALSPCAHNQKPQKSVRKIEIQSPKYMATRNRLARANFGSIKIYKLFEITGDRQAPRHIAMPLPHVYVGLYENTHPSHRNHVRR